MNRPLFEGFSGMKFDSSKVAFGRHETFALRYSWLSKGFQALSDDPKVFESDDATVVLGVGKNMVAAIRYWLRAAQIIHPTEPEPTEIGQMVFDVDEGLDPYLEDEGTIWLIHWLISTNAELATSFFWFFNKFHKPEFTSQELSTALSDFVKEYVAENKRAAATTLKQDAQLLHRMYTQSKGNSRMPLEEALDSPLSVLRLVSQTAGGRSFRSNPDSRPGLPVGIIGYAICQIMEERGISSIPIEELMYSKSDFASPGSVFRLTENELITKIERLIEYNPNIFEIRETAGIHQLYRVGKVSALDYVKLHYSEIVQGAAA